MRKQLVTIICPVHNEEKTILLFYERITPILEKLEPRYVFEINFSNNRSTDNTLNIIRDLAKKDKRVNFLTLTRNFGYQASVQASLAHARGDCIITIDADCEDPPELIPTFLEKWEEGYDVVYGLRSNRPEPKILIGMRNLFYKVLRFTADANIILNMAEFGLVADYVRDGIVSNSNTFPFLRTEIAYLGYNAYGVRYDRQVRVAGKTHYNFWRLLTFAVGGILSSSTFVFRLAVYLLPFFFFFNVAMLFGELLFGGNYFKILIVADFLYLNLLMALHGVYLARIYKNGTGRPIYRIDWKLSSAKLNPAPMNSGKRGQK